jgi:hypothetical protein
MPAIDAGASARIPNAAAGTAARLNCIGSSLFRDGASTALTSTPGVRPENSSGDCTGGLPIRQPRDSHQAALVVRMGTDSGGREAQDPGW